VRGIGTLVAMMMVGKLIRLIDPRILVFLGLCMSTWSLWMSIGFSPDTSAHTISMVSVVQGFGLGFVFVPLNTIAFATLPAALRTDGTALWTLIRNIGSSIGISIVIAQLTSKTTMFHSQLVEHVTPFNPALADPDVAGILNLGTDTGRALMDQIVTREATIMAFQNDFQLMMWISLAAFPLLLALRGGKSAAKAQVSAAHAME
jgi:DHA2 family multidrug resistance protein